MSKSLFIIGAGPGIGQATAERFGREGWTIVMASRNPRNLDPLVAELVGKGITAHGIVLDATDAQAMRSAVRNADRITGGLTGVFYNAAFVRKQDLFTMTDADVLNDLAVNVAGGLHAIRAGTELFDKRGGTILITGGGFALAPHHSYASLGMGKAALRNVVQAIAPQLAERNVRIAMMTVATLITPHSAEADGVADGFWSLAHGAADVWEAVYPAALAE
ncbi:SDR family NAD(P)-dependent oxidoreductase [Bradyrhizobium sp. CCBAU 51765]|uniref:SDR family NAD(P)-dependent oxidoreductase n=1 Tax=Bradyrhizobium sp. CCBAU 51765 TaxID=1325102 RepID=UPI001888EF5A|nr:SDR family oxidoreductase [Bradyrhizobium sp. CCBAU 51765]QOZ07841.1 SDR family NAD(P)-dependent oxidoreductase [Bradyrhizobium sp. CCBAU 51765]